jgi:hypothetical protein
VSGAADETRVSVGNFEEGEYSSMFVGAADDGGGGGDGSRTLRDELEKGNREKVGVNTREEEAGKTNVDATEHTVDMLDFEEDSGKSRLLNAGHDREGEEVEAGPTPKEAPQGGNAHEEEQEKEAGGADAAEKDDEEDDDAMSAAADAKADEEADPLAAVFKSLLAAQQQQVGGGDRGGSGGLSRSKLSAALRSKDPQGLEARAMLRKGLGLHSLKINSKRARKAFEDVFVCVDVDRSGTLELHEVRAFAADVKCVAALFAVEHARAEKEKGGGGGGGGGRGGVHAPTPERGAEAAATAEVDGGTGDDNGVSSTPLCSSSHPHLDPAIFSLLNEAASQCSNRELGHAEIIAAMRTHPEIREILHAQDFDDEASLEAER